jgi:hypothetical protein
MAEAAGFRRRLPRLLLLLLLLLLSTVEAARHTSNTSTLYVIRHGEKKWALGCLSARGLARARALPGIFDGVAGVASPKHATFDRPAYIYANLYADPIDCERCVQTVAPLAAALGLPLNQSYGYPKKLGGNALAAQVMLERTLGRPGTVVLAAWEHINIQFLVEAMGVPRASVPSWPGSDYDTVYVVTVDAHAKLLRFSVAHENYTYTPGGANTTI